MWVLIWSKKCRGCWQRSHGLFLVFHYEGDISIILDIPIVVLIRNQLAKTVLPRESFLGDASIVLQKCLVTTPKVDVFLRFTQKLPLGEVVSRAGSGVPSFGQVFCALLASHPVELIRLLASPRNSLGRRHSVSLSGKQSVCCFGCHPKYSESIDHGCRG